MNAIEWITVSIVVIMVLILTLSSIQLTLSWWTNLKAVPDRAQKCGSVIRWITNISFTITAILILCQIVIYMITNNKSSNMFNITGRISIGMYLLSQTLMIFIFTTRIDFTFKKSGFEYSNCIIKSLYICAICLVLFYIFTVIAVIFSLWFILFMTGMIWCFLYLILSITLMTLFIRKMEIILIKNMKYHENDCQSSSTINTLIDSELIYVVIKHGLLIPIAICSSFICSITSLSLSYTDSDGSGWQITSAFWYILDCTLSALSIYLLFGFNKLIYNTICYPMHHCCENCELWKLKMKYTKQCDNKQENEMPVTVPTK